MTRKFMAHLVVGLIVLGGCSDGDTKLDEHLTVANVTPTGSVGGMILDATDDSPLGGVEVLVVAGDLQVTDTTDGSGLFEVTNVPASGPVLVTFRKAGYLSGDLVAQFTNAAGDFPVNNATVTVGPVGMLPSDGDFTVYVFDENGRPAQGHLLTLTTGVRFFNYQAGTPINSGSVTVTAQVGGSGMATFFSIPDFWSLGAKADSTVDIAVPPYDADGDDFYEFAGGTYTWDLLDLDNPQPTILMTTGDYPPNLAIEASNVQALETGSTVGYAPSAIPTVGPIHVLFNQPIQEPTVAVSVFNEEGTVPYTPQTQVSGRSLTITFPTALPVGEEFNLNITATATTGDLLRTGSFSAPFFVIDESAEVTATVTTETDLLDPTRIVEFSEPVGFGLPGVQLSGGNCVIFYDFWQVGPGGSTGDDPGELGNSQCSFALIPDEPVPAQPAGAGYSGYTRFWRFEVPLIDGSTQLIPAGTDVYLRFGMVDNTSRIMRRANGAPVPEIVITLPSS